MTPAERALRDRIRRKAAAMTPEMARRQLAAYEIIRDSLTERELAQAIRNGTIDGLLERVLSDEALDPAFARLRAHIDQAVLDAAKAVDLPRKYMTAFDILSPNVIRAVRSLDTRVISGLKDEVRETVRNHVLAGVEAGKGPRTIARGVREMIGLAPNQEQAVRNFQRMLEAGDREALTRALRNRRYDKLLERALGEGGTGLTPSQVRTMTDAYRRRMVAFNAETHARTVALDSQRLAQRLSWMNAVDKGIVATDQLERTWIAVGGPTGDGRNRPEHLKLHGTTVSWDQPYPNGEVVPGESTYSCRCIERVRVKPPMEQAA